MNISLNWLTEYVNVAMPAEQLGELFTRIGLNCEGIAESDADIVFDLEVTSNRPDWLGHLGVARELAAAIGAEFTPPRVRELPTSGSAADLTDVTVRDPDLCDRYTARVIRNVQVGPSPQWLVDALEAVGLRSVNNIVDVTNFVLMEYSQPLHAFDYDKLEGHRIIVRRARAGEELVSIDETVCKLDENMLVIADTAKPVAVAGVMGGRNTEVTEQTRHVLIESARFDPLTTRRTSRKLGLMSESNYRFERGIDPVGVDVASMRACQLVLDVAGGELAGGVVDVWDRPWQARQVELRPERANALLGLEIPVQRQVEVLGGLGLQPHQQDGRIRCTIPSHRADLKREADLIEEVARIVGYDKIPTRSETSVKVHREGPVQQTRLRVGQLLTAAGFDEAITFTFIDADEAGLFGFDKTVDVDSMVRRTNNTLRPTAIPSLLAACKTNQDAGNGQVQLFELSTVFRRTGQALPEQYVELAMVTDRELRSLRGAIEALAERLVPGGQMEIHPARAAGFAEGTAAEIHLNGEKWGVLGYVAQAAQDRYDLESRRAAASLHLDPLVAAAEVVRTYQPVPRFPAVQRDLSLILDESVTWQELSDAIEKVDQPLRTGADYVTTYRGKQIEPGRKSVTVQLTYRSPDGTLRREEVDRQVQQVVEALAEGFSAQLRS